jgi:hypothetical protein
VAESIEQREKTDSRTSGISSETKKLATDTAPSKNYFSIGLVSPH